MEFIYSTYAAHMSASSSPTIPKPPALPILPLTALDTLPRWCDEQVEVRREEKEEGAASVVAISSPASISAARSSASSSPSAFSLPRPARPSSRIQFPVNPSLNHKLILTRGDIIGLRVDALVHSTNERLNDSHLSALGSRVQAYCGREFTEECRALMKTDGGLATGDSVLVSSHALGKLHGGARSIIHTVTPKYSAKYEIAATNAMHSCVRRSLEVMLDSQQPHTTVAFPLLAIPRKQYPLTDAAHVIFRTLRKFCERYGEKTIDTIVFCLQDGNTPALTPSALAAVNLHHQDIALLEAGTTSPLIRPIHAQPVENESAAFEIFSRILPLYFPRSEEEAQLQLKYLPEETGDELGETTVAARKIRIGEFIKSGPVPFDEISRDNQPNSAASSASAVVSSSSSAAASSSQPRRSSFSSSFVPPPPAPTEYVSPSEMPVEPSRRSVVAPKVDIIKDASNFASVQSHPDAKRAVDTSASSSVASTANLTPEEAAREARDEYEYFQVLKHAQCNREEDMTKLDAMNYIVDTRRRDALGRQIIFLVGSRLIYTLSDGCTQNITRENLTDHIVRTLDALTLHPYILVYFHTSVTASNRVDFQWFIETWNLFPRRHRANLRQLLIVHPSYYLRSSLWLAASMTNPPSFWEKIVYIWKISELSSYLDSRTLSEIPRHVQQCEGGQ